MTAGLFVERCAAYFLVFLFLCNFSTGNAAPAAIESIEIERMNIFDHMLRYDYDPVINFMNDLHHMTDEDIIRKEFGLDVGEAFSVEKMRERESYLRRLGIFSEVQIDTFRTSANGMRISVRTVDRWSTFIPVYFNFTSGQQDFSIGFREINLHGRRKTLGVELTRKDGVYSGLMEIVDPRLLGTRNQVASGLGFSDTRFGTWYLQLWRPYLFTEDRFSWGLRFSRLFSSSFNYDEGVIVEEWSREYDTSSGYFSSAPGSLFRFSAGYDRNVFKWDSDGSVTNASSQAVFFNTTINDYVYAKRYYINKLGPVEEVAEGWKLGMTLGAGTSSPGNERNMGYAAGRFSIAALGKSHYITFTYEKSGFFCWQDGTTREVHESVQIAGFFQQKKVHNMVFRAGFFRSGNLAGPGEYSLGGFNGLRGYPPHFFNGDSLIRVNIEQRLLIFRSGKLTKLLLVPFFDTGSAWSESSANFGSALGFGLRFGSMENMSVTTFRIDLAFPLGIESGPMISFGTAHYFSPVRSFIFGWPGIRFFKNIDWG